MVDYSNLIYLLNRYGIDGEKLIKNNENVLPFSDYQEVEKIILFLQKIGIKAKNIEKCPSILFMRTVKEIEENYDFLINETELQHVDVEDCLHILNSNLGEMKKIYSYVCDKFGVVVLQRTPSILSGNYDNIVSLTNFLKRTIGLSIVINHGGSILSYTTSSEFEKVLSIPEFQYNLITKSYNKKLLTSTTFRRTYIEIKEILELPEWKEEKFQPLLTSNVWVKDASQIKEILKLPEWKEEKFQPLLTSSVWFKDASQIKEILKLSEWKEEKFQPLLTSTIWLKNASQIKEILELPEWKEEKFQPLLTSSVWLKDASQIKEILELPEWKEEKFQPLLTSTIWLKDANQIKEILELPEWKEEKFQPLLTSTIWLKDANQIKEILELPEWKEEKFQPLLTSSVWHKDASQIKKILELPDWKEEKFQPLLTSSIWVKDANQIKEILELPEWKEEKFQPILTPNVWHKDASQIKKILELPEWKEEKFQPLLTSSIWVKDANQIRVNIMICENNGLETFVNNPTLILRLTANELQAKINYLKYHNIPLYDERGKICNIFGMSNKNMQVKYGISKKELIRDYLNIEVNKNVL